MRDKYIQIHSYDISTKKVQDDMHVYLKLFKMQVHHPYYRHNKITLTDQKGELKLKAHVSKLIGHDAQVPKVMTASLKICFFLSTLLVSCFPGWVTLATSNEEYFAVGEGQ